MSPSQQSSRLSGALKEGINLITGLSLNRHRNHKIRLTIGGRGEEIQPTGEDLKLSGPETARMDFCESLLV